jgi:hypothetical protein
MFKYLDKVDFNKNDLPLLLKKVRWNEESVLNCDMLS